MATLYETAVRTHARGHLAGAEVEDRLRRRLDWRDEQGDITPMMVGIAIMTGAAITVLGIVVVKLTNKANALQLQ